MTILRNYELEANYLDQEVHFLIHYSSFIWTISFSSWFDHVCGYFLSWIIQLRYLVWETIKLVSKPCEWIDLSEKMDWNSSLLLSIDDYFEDSFIFSTCINLVYDAYRLGSMVWFWSLLVQIIQGAVQHICLRWLHKHVHDYLWYHLLIVTRNLHLSHRIVWNLFWLITVWIIRSY